MRGSVKLTLFLKYIQRKQENQMIKHIDSNTLHFYL